LWDASHLSDSPQIRNKAKLRVREYIKAVANANAVDWEALRDRVSSALSAMGHQGWVVDCGHLCVRVVDANGKAWECKSCRRVHWHPTAGVCTRCLSKMELVPGGA